MLVSRGLGRVLADLASLGFDAKWGIVGAHQTGAPHKRDRIWLLAHTSKFRPQKQRPELKTTRFKRVGEDVAHTQCQSVRNEGSGQDAGETSSLQGELRERQRIRVDASECGKDVAHSNGTRLQGFTESNISGGEGQWQTAGNGLPTNANPGKFVGRLGGSLDGLPEGLDMPGRWGDGTWEEGVPRVTTERKNRTHRLKALGNAIVPQVAYEIIRCMKEIDESF